MMLRLMWCCWNRFCNDLAFGSKRNSRQNYNSHGHRLRRNRARGTAKPCSALGASGALGALAGCNAVRRRLARPCLRSAPFSRFPRAARGGFLHLARGPHMCPSLGSSHAYRIVSLSYGGTFNLLLVRLFACRWALVGVSISPFLS